MISDMNSTSRGLLNQREIVEEYVSSLEDLKANSKPHINFLTLLAEDNIVFAPAIVNGIEAHLKKVQSDVKLPVLYLIDSIIKNVKKSYVNLFSQKIENLFCDVFQKVDDSTRQKMFKLRQTWKEIFPADKLHDLDIKVQRIDRNWPVVNLPPNANAAKSIIHINPRFLSRQPKPPQPAVPNKTPEPDANVMTEEQMREELLKKQRELNNLKKQKEKLAKLQQQQKKCEQVETQAKPDMIAFDDTLISNTVPSETQKSVDNKRESSPTPSENQLTLTDDALERELLAIQNGGKIVEDIPEEPPTPLPLQQQQQQQQQEISTKAFESLELGNESSLVKASSFNSRDEILELEMELSMIINDNKVHDNERSQRSSNSSQKTNKPQAEARPKNSSERSPSKSSSVRASSSSSSTSKQQPQQPQQQQQHHQSEPSTTSRTSRSKSSSSSSRRKKSSKPSSRKRSRSPHHHSSHHHHRERHRHHHRAPRHRERHHTTPPKLGLDEEEQLGGSLIVSPPQPLANVKPSQSQTPQKQQSTRRNSSGSASSTRTPRSRKEKSTSRTPSPDDANKSLRRDSLSSRDEDLRATLNVSTQSCNTSTSVKLDSKEDLDLRVLPMTANKRASSERLLSPSVKKSKNDDFDVLFGKEDVDLRVLNPAPKTLAQPPTPPPPVISNTKDGWAKFKTPTKSESSRSESRNSERSTSKDRSSRDRPSRNKFYNKQSATSDTKDRRRSGNRDYERNSDRNIEIIMKQAAEQLNQGTITKSQYNKLIQEVFHMSEDQKIRAAQRKEREGKIWERHDKGLRGKDHGMHPRMPGPRWQQPWHQPWAHPPGPFQGPFRPEFRPMGPWQNHPRMFGGPVRPDFHQFHGGCFNPRVGLPPMGPNGPMMLPNGPMKPLGPGMNSMKGPMGPGPMSPGMMMGANTGLPKRLSSGDNTPDNSNWSNSSFNDGKSDAEVSSSCNDDLPPVDTKLLEEIFKDTMRSINIDNIPREIRYYGEEGVIFMHWDDPRDIGFQNGARRVYIDGKEAVVCSFNDDYREFTYDGEVHKIKLGAPTRELFIDGQWYQCYFGGQPITVDLGKKTVNVKLEGPPPQVKVGNVKRTDLVLGKINVIINARSMVPVFLDAKPQMFHIEGKPCTIEFMDALMTVLLNGRPFSVEFGGLPMPVMVFGKKHFIRFSVLPRGFRAGYVNITGMKGEKPRELPPDNLKKDQMEVSSTTPAVLSSPIEPDSTSQDGMEISYNVKSDLQLDVLSSVVPSSMAPSSGLSYQVEPVENLTTAASAFTLPLNLSELFQRLVETGIVTNLGEVKKEKEEEEKKEPEVILVSFDKPETLRIKQPSMVTALYSGIQCSSCGARFAPEMATRYSHHLDWHFRQNRKERDSSRKAHSRLWYYDNSDWIQFEEIEDLEDRAQSWFETEKQTMETENAAAEELFAETMQPSVPTGSDEDAFCQVCHEAFEQFYNDEKEEWHLRPAITFEDKNFHPVCLEDHKRLKEATAAGLADASDTKDDNKENNCDSASTVREETSAESGENDESNSLEKETSETVNESDPVAIESTPVVDSKIEESAPEIPVEQEDDKTEEKLDPEIGNDSEMPEASDESKIEEPAESAESIPMETEVTNETTTSEAKEKAESEQETEECPAESSIVDSTQVEVKSTIDGNVELESTLPSIPTTQSKIIINITKPLNSPKESAEAKEEKPAEEEEPEPEPEPLQPASIKPVLRDRNMSVLPPMKKGEELSGLCSIM